MALNDKLINFGNLSEFKTKLDAEKLVAGENISIEDGKVSAIGYKASSTPSRGGFTEFPSLKIDADMEFPLSQVGITDLTLTGDAGATTYTYGGGGAVTFGTIAGMLIDMGALLQVGNSDKGKILSVDSSNNTVTFDVTLDADNAISSGSVTAMYVPIVLLFSGAANATTYTVSDPASSRSIAIIDAGQKLSIGNYPLTEVVSVDRTNSTVTFVETLDATNAVSGARMNYIIKANNTASGPVSHAEGEGTTASGEASHAEGVNTTASGVSAHSEGWGTTTQNRGEHSEGNNNTSHKASDTYGDAGNTTHSVGIGFAGSLKNAFEIMQNGDMYVYGVGGYQGRDTTVQDATIKTLQAYLASLEARINALEGNTTVL